MIRDIIFAFWFLLPAAYGNVAPILVAAVPALKRFDRPIDGGKKFRGKELFGAHKTWRGFISGMILATIVLGLEQLAFKHFGWARYAAHTVNYALLPTLILGPLFGLGALAGDAIESFLKRQRGIPSGYSWLPYDQLDYIVGGVVASLPFVSLKMSEYAWIFAVWFVMHLLSSYAGWLMGLKERPL